MLEHYSSIKFSTLPTEPHCITPDRGHKELNLEDPAIAVMTDHRIDKAPSCGERASITRIMRKMAEENSNMLFVENNEQNIVGLITSPDITGEKPIKLQQNHQKHRDELVATDLMTPIDSIPVLHISDVIQAKIGDILHTLNETGSGYVLVSTEQDGQAAIRGVFNSQAIARSLKIFFDPSPAARTFADFTKALHHSTASH